MPRLTGIFLFIASLFSACCALAADGLSERNSALLARLDSLLDRSADIMAGKEAQIKSLRKSYEIAADPSHRFLAAYSLVNELLPYDGDSAMVYIGIAEKLARENNFPGLTDILLDKIYVLTIRGNLTDALRSYADIDHRKLNKEDLIKYIAFGFFMKDRRWFNFGDNASEKQYWNEFDHLADSVVQTMTPNDNYFAWVKMRVSQSDPGKIDEAISQISSTLDNREIVTHADALSAWALSQLYEQKGDRENAMKYLILSAIADTRSCVNEVSSYSIIASYFFEKGDLERAGRYINKSLECSLKYKSRTRIEEVAQSQRDILGTLNEKTNRQVTQNRLMSWILVCIVVLLVIAIIFIIRQIKEVQKSRRDLHEANKQLKSHVEELQRTQKELNEANASLTVLYDQAKENAAHLSGISEAQEAYIANIFAICSDYITKIDDFRKNIYRMLMARRFDELIELTKSRDMSHSEVKELCANFDLIFLKMYPNFVEEFNSLLREEERIILKNPGTLTSELRIYALIRLGITETSKIAAFLHLSMQTVYNTRQKARSKSLGNKDDFEADVKRQTKINL